MSGKADWLYGLIFIEARTVWNVAIRFAEEISEPEAPQLPPQSLRVQQCAGVDLKHGFTSGPILREWLFNGADFTEQAVSPVLADRKEQSRLPFPIPEKKRTVQGALFTEGMFCFYLFPERRRVLITYQLGPRFGRGVVYDVVGQGSRAKLTRAADAPGWIS